MPIRVCYRSSLHTIIRLLVNMNEAFSWHAQHGQTAASRSTGRLHSCLLPHADLDAAAMPQLVNFSFSGNRMRGALPVTLGQTHKGIINMFLGGNLDVSSTLPTGRLLCQMGISLLN